MKTESKNACVFLRQAATGLEPPTIGLKSGTVMARVQPGKLSIEVHATYLTRVQAFLDGQEVLSTKDLLRPGSHTLKADALTFSPKPSAAPVVKDDEPGALDHLAELGLEPEGQPIKHLTPYTGAPGGILTVKLAYFEEDHGAQVTQHEFAADEVRYKLNAGEDFDLALAHNMHRIVLTQDENAKDAPLCACCKLH